jgi:hypothetical protein
LFFTLKNVSAQTAKFQYGVKGGLNLSTALVNDAIAMRFKYGYYIGGTVKYLVTSKFELQTGLFFSEQGSKIDGLNGSEYVGGKPDFTHTFNQLYLKLPLYAALRKNISNSLNVSIGFGPYIGYGIGGKTRKNLNSSIYSDGSTETMWDTFGNGIFDEERYWLRGETLERFDFGAGFNIDIDYNKFICGIGFESSIIDVLNHKGNYSRDLRYRNINFRVFTGYRF